MINLVNVVWWCMARGIVVGVALLLSQATLALADARRGDIAFEKGDYAGAHREWRESAEAGDISAMLGLGTLYNTGHGVQQDFVQALSWYRRAAEAGNAHAMFNVGAMFDNGRGTDVNRPEAVRWYVRSAARGNGRAAYAVATIYRDGDGVPRDTRAAIKFFKMAAAAGIGAARVNLANLGQSALPDSVAGPSRSPGAATKAFENTPAVAKLAPEALPTAVGTANVEAKPLGPTAMTPKVARNDEAAAAPARPPAVARAVPDAPASAADDRFAAAPTSIPAPGTSSGPSPVQIADQETLAAGIERFHKLALQHADASLALSTQYEAVVHEVARRAMEGNDVAQYDIGFAYKQGIGVPSDLVKSYVYFVRASLSSNAELSSAALSEAFHLGSRLTDAQQALTTDMLTRGTR